MNYKTFCFFLRDTPAHQVEELQIINTAVAIYKDIKAIYEQTKADKAAKEAAAAAIPNNTLAVA